MSWQGKGRTPVLGEDRYLPKQRAAFASESWWFKWCEESREGDRQ